MAPGGPLPLVFPPEYWPGTPQNKKFRRDNYNALKKVGKFIISTIDFINEGEMGKDIYDVFHSKAKEKAECERSDNECNPPEGTKCYEGPDYGKSHGGLSPHYHIFQMQKKRPSGICFWRYLGGKVGVGVLKTPPAGMQPCSSYSNFTGRN